MAKAPAKKKAAKATTKKPAAEAPADDAARHGIGGNQPPEHERLLMELEDVHLEAQNFLDGEEIETDGQADAVAAFVKKARALKKEAEEARKAEKEPHLEAGRAVDAKFKPITTRADVIVKAANAPLARYLERLEQRRREEAEQARRDAELAQREAEAKRRAAEEKGNLDELEAAEAAQDEADELFKDAKKAEKQKANIGGGDGSRAIGLRTKTEVEVVDNRALLNHIIKTNPEPLREWLREYAKRALPTHLAGCEYTQKRVAQ